MSVTVKATCDVQITRDHVSKFFRECDDPFARFLVIREAALSGEHLAELREFFAGKPASLKVIDALEGVSKAIEELK